MYSEIENIDKLNELDLVTFMLAANDKNNSKHRDIFTECFNELFKRSCPDYVNIDDSIELVLINITRNRIREALGGFGDDTLLQLQFIAQSFRIPMHKFETLREVLYGRRIASLVATFNPSINENPYFIEG